MAKTTIQKLDEFGQSIWLDNINRSMIKTGKLKEMLQEGLLGMTSNPTIFDKAISSAEYDEKIKELCVSGKSGFEIYDDLTVKDVQDAADIFKTVYEKTNGLDGYVSLEVNPKLALKKAETIEEAKRLHKKVNRPNVMLKIPATTEGFGAIEELVGQGINVNATLIFSLEQYKGTAQAYLRGIKKFAGKQGDLTKVRSVASVFVSRVVNIVDKLIDERMAGGGSGSLQSLKGKAAVANSKRIFDEYTGIFSGHGFAELKKKGANPQRALWASTSTKNPAYSDIKYVTELTGKNTVNTLPDKTYAAFMDHGTVKDSLASGSKDANDAIEGLKKEGINVDSVCKKLLDDGVKAFEKSFESLLNTIETKTKALCKTL